MVKGIVRRILLKVALAALLLLMLYGVIPDLAGMDIVLIRHSRPDASLRLGVLA